MISVVVPAYNAADTVEGCLNALLSQSMPRDQYEIVVVDDGSLDRTAEVIASFAGQGVRLVQQKNQGAASARNAGAAVAQGDLLLLTDSDCEPVPTWMEEFARAFADPEVMGAKGTLLTHQRGLVPRFMQVEYEDRYDRYAGRERIDFIDTGSAAYRRAVFLENGGFDTSVRFVEDQEFSFRLAEKGYKLVFVPKAQVYHRHDRDLVEYLERKFNTGKWKAGVMQRHPDRIVSDTHTPLTLKLQLVLMMLALPLLAAGLVVWQAGAAGWQVILGAGLGAVLIFLLSSVPFGVKVLRRDAGVALIAPFMLALRALALGTGYAIGSLRLLRDTERPEQKPLLSARHRLIKRLMDLAGAAVGLALAAPFLLAFAIAIKLDSPGPAFYVQERVGASGRVFRMLKLRTMQQDADRRLHELVDLDQLDEPAFKLRNDPRITRVGRILRRFSLDELPQFVNVLRGDMSLVGPRPEEVQVVRLYNDRQRRRLAVKPGMTGPMQVNGRGNLTLTQRLELELDYIEHYSVRHDISILLRTAPAVLQGQGAY
jgi:lipopolysaccharide/colanic/teichoic acid biosynthesis glycosyltransferase/glycosyltransferase involved in cell wall biosynthesis